MSFEKVEARRQECSEENRQEPMACGHWKVCGVLNEDAPIEILECGWCGELRQAKEHERWVVDKASKEAYTQGKCDMLSELTSSDATIQAAVEKAVAITVERCAIELEKRVDLEDAQMSWLVEIIRSLSPDPSYLIKQRLAWIRDAMKDSSLLIRGYYQSGEFVSEGVVADSVSIADLCGELALAALG
jgi:hypothetical protein